MQLAPRVYMEINISYFYAVGNSIIALRGKAICNKNYCGVKKSFTLKCHYNMQEIFEILKFIIYTFYESYLYILYIKD